MFDILIVGAEIVSSTGRLRKSIGIKDGKIEALIDPGDAAPARETIDAHGQILIPGLVDSHVHFREPGLVHKEGFASGSRAAAAGGVTTVMVMPTDNPITVTPEQFLEKKQLAEGRCFVDYAFQAALGTDTQFVRPLADLGAVSFELFLADFPPPILVDSARDLLAALAAVRSVEGVAGITPGDDSIVRGLTEAEQRDHPTDPMSFARSRPPIAEALGLARACLAVSETGVRAHIRQVSCRRSVNVLQALAPADLSSEVTPHNLALEAGELAKQGPVAKVAPPLRAADDIEAVRSALRDGTIRTVATDHAPHSPEEKRAGDQNIWKAPGGFPGVQTFLPVMLKLIGDGILDYPDLVRACCEVPAKTFGLFPQKGSFAIGADADFVLIDPRRPFTIRNEDQQSKARLTPFNGWVAPATPVLALLRGRVIMRDGVPVGEPAGRLLRPH
jgi:dihydroorotase